MRFVLLAVALMLAGCAEPIYTWTKSGPHSFDQDSTACKADISKRLKETPVLYAWKDGSTPSSGRNQQWAQVEYNKCMRVAGYTPSGETTAAALNATTPVKTPTATATAPPSPVTMNMAGRLRELRGLLDQGLITQAEYDQRREAMLGQM